MENTEDDTYYYFIVDNSLQSVIEYSMKKSKAYPKALCKECKEEYEQKRKWHKFCSDYCRYKYFDKTHPRVKINEQV